MDIVSGITSLVSTIISRVWPDKTEQEKEAFTLQLTKELDTSKLLQGQLSIDANEAANANWWVAGARPAILWICAAIFAWQFLFQHMITYFLTISGHPVPTMPVFDTDEIMNIMFGMLGLSGMRTYEKIQGVQSKH